MRRKPQNKMCALSIPKTKTITNRFKTKSKVDVKVRRKTIQKIFPLTNKMSENNVLIEVIPISDDFTTVVNKKKKNAN